MIEGYIPQTQRKKILLIADDIRMSSGVANMAREIVINTAHVFNWVNLGGLIKHPDEGKRLDLNEDTNRRVGINDSSVILYPTTGYGNPDLIRQLIQIEKPDAILLFTDPRYFIWLFQMESEIRRTIPIIYYNIWDDLPYPMYNKSYYESCDGLLAISKQTKNINEVVLGEYIKDKIIKYVPHGIDEKIFFPIKSHHPEYLHLQEMKKQLFKGKEYEFVAIWNSRNIARKCPSTILESWKYFVDNLDEEQASKTALIMHSQPLDENGTNLFAVADMLFGNDNKYNVIFSEQRYTPEQMNLLYNCADVGILISSNEGWGLSLTEAMMCGRPIIANVSGGMQDQMRFEDSDGNWIEFNENIPSNHKGHFDKHGKWAFPVFPSNLTLVGSQLTPYIYDDRVCAVDLSHKIHEVYLTKTSPEWEDICDSAREWVISEESMMTSKRMSNNMIEGINETLNKFKPKNKFELIKVELPKQPKHFNKYLHE